MPTVIIEVYCIFFLNSQGHGSVQLFFLWVDRRNFGNKGARVTYVKRQCDIILSQPLKQNKNRQKQSEGITFGMRRFFCGYLFRVVLTW